MVDMLDVGPLDDEAHNVLVEWVGLERDQWACEELNVV